MSSSSSNAAETEKNEIDELSCILEAEDLTDLDILTEEESKVEYEKEGDNRLQREENTDERDGSVNEADLELSQQEEAEVGGSDVDAFNWEGFEVVDELSDVEQPAEEKSSEIKHQSKRRDSNERGRESDSRNEFSRFRSHRNERDNRCRDNRKYESSRKSFGRSGNAKDRYRNDDRRHRRSYSRDRDKSGRESRGDSHKDSSGKGKSKNPDEEKSGMSSSKQADGQDDERSNTGKDGEEKENTSVKKENSPRQDSPGDKGRKKDVRDPDLESKETAMDDKAESRTRPINVVTSERQGSRPRQKSWVDFSTEKQGSMPRQKRCWVDFPPLRETASIKKVSCRSNWKNYRRVVIIGDDRIHFDKDTLDMKTPHREMLVFNHPQLTLDEIADFVKENVDLSSPGETMLICSVGTYDIISLQNIASCQKLSDHEPFKQITVKSSDEKELGKDLIQKAKDQKKKLQQMLGSDSEVYFMTIIPVDIIKCHDHKVSAHKKISEHELDLEFSSDDLREMQTTASEAIDLFNMYNFKNNLSTLPLDINEYPQRLTKKNESDGVNLTPVFSKGICSSLAKAFKKFIIIRSRYEKVVFVGDSRLEHIRKAWPTDLRYNCKIITDPDLTLGNLSNLSDPVVKELFSARNSLIVITLGINDLCKLVPHEECSSHKNLEILMPLYVVEDSTVPYEKFKLSTFLERIIHNFRRMTYNCDLIFMPIYDFDLLSYQDYVTSLHEKEENHVIQTPMIDLESDFTENFKGLLNLVHLFNVICTYVSLKFPVQLRSFPSWVPERVRDEKGELRRISPEVLYDGVHPSPSLAKEMAERYQAFANEALKIGFWHSESFTPPNEKVLCDILTKCRRNTSRQMDEVTKLVVKDIHKVKNLSDLGDKDVTSDYREKTSERRESRSLSSKTPSSGVSGKQADGQPLETLLSDVSDMDDSDVNLPSFDVEGSNSKRATLQRSTSSRRVRDDVRTKYGQTRVHSPAVYTKNFSRSFSGSSKSHSCSSPSVPARKYVRSISYPTQENFSGFQTYSGSSSSRYRRTSERRNYSRSPSVSDRFHSSSYSSSSSSRSPSPEKSREHKAIMSLREFHNRECAAYRKHPNAHPDYDKEFRIYKDKKMQCIIELGGDPYAYDITRDWKKFWSSRLEELLEVSWITKRDKCLEMLHRGKTSKKIPPVSKSDVAEKKGSQRYSKSTKLKRKLSRSRSSSRDSEVIPTHKQKGIKMNREYSRNKKKIKSPDSHRNYSDEEMIDASLDCRRVSEGRDSREPESERVRGVVSEAERLLERQRSEEDFERYDANESENSRLRNIVTDERIQMKCTADLGDNIVSNRSGIQGERFGSDLKGSSTADSEGTERERFIADHKGSSKSKLDEAEGDRFIETQRGKVKSPSEQILSSGSDTTTAKQPVMKTQPLQDAKSKQLPEQSVYPGSDTGIVRQQSLSTQSAQDARSKQFPEQSVYPGSNPGIVRQQAVNTQPLQDARSKRFPGSSRVQAFECDIEKPRGTSSIKGALPSASKEEPADEVTSTTPSFEVGKQEDMIEILEILSRLGDRLGVLKIPLKVVYEKALQYKSSGFDGSRLLEEKDAKTLLHLISCKLSKMVDEESLSVIQKVIIQEANERLNSILNSSGPDLDSSLIAEKCLGKNESDTIAYIQSQFLECGIADTSREQLKEVYAAVKLEKSKLLSQILRQTNTAPAGGSSSKSVAETSRSINLVTSRDPEVVTYSPSQVNWSSEDSQDFSHSKERSTILPVRVPVKEASKDIFTSYSGHLSKPKVDFPPRRQYEDHSKASDVSSTVHPRDAYEYPAKSQLSSAIAKLTKGRDGPPSQEYASEKHAGSSGPVSAGTFDYSVLSPSTSKAPNPKTFGTFGSQGSPLTRSQDSPFTGSLGSPFTGSLGSPFPGESVVRPTYSKAQEIVPPEVISFPAQKGPIRLVIPKTAKQGGNMRPRTPSMDDSGW